MSDDSAGLNLFGEDWEDGRERPGWRWKHVGVGRRLGATQIGASLYELAPGQKTFPYHWHVVQEELLIVLSGEPTLRDPSGERRLATGDVVLFKRGPEGAHSVRNDTEQPVRLLVVSSDRDTPGESPSTRTAARSACGAPGSARSSTRTPSSTTSTAKSRK